MAPLVLIEAAPIPHPKVEIRCDFPKQLKGKQSLPAELSPLPMLPKIEEPVTEMEFIVPMIPSPRNDPIILNPIIVASEKQTQAPHIDQEDKKGKKDEDQKVFEVKEEPLPPNPKPQPQGPVFSLNPNAQPFVRPLNMLSDEYTGGIDFEQKKKRTHRAGKKFKGKKGGNQ
jgi:hypothetical protein